MRAPPGAPGGDSGDGRETHQGPTDFSDRPERDQPRSYDQPMPGGTDALVVAGQQALVARDWAAARGSFEAALEQEETAEALNGLGIALGWSDEIDASLRYRERAYAGRRSRSPTASQTLRAPTPSFAR
jgi:uncharacterized protein HemY